MLSNPLARQADSLSFSSLASFQGHQPWHKTSLRVSRRLVVVVALLWISVWGARAGAAEKVVDQFFDSKGVKIRYQVQGEGEPLILLHGFTASIEGQWEAPGIRARLAKDFQVIALDARGHGKSDKPHDAMQYGREMIGDVVRLMDHLKIAKAHIVGYSMGAFMTNRFLAQHPDRFITATLGGAGWKKPDHDPLGTLDKLAESLEAGKGITPLLELLNPVGRPKPTQQQLDTINFFIMATNDQKALAACVRGMANLSVTEAECRANKIPTLAIVGANDPLKLTVDDLAQVMPELKVQVIDGTDHVTCFFHPKFVEEVKTFVAAHSVAKSLPLDQQR